MANDSLELSLKIQAAVEGLGEVAKLAGEIEQLGGDATEVRDKAGALAEQMAALGKQQTLIDQFNQLSGAANTAEKALEESTRRAGELSQKFKDSAITVSGLQGALDKARQALVDATSPEEVKRLNAEIKSLSKELKNAEKGSSVLGSQLKNTEEATDKWSEKLQMTREELEKLDGEMRAVGVDTSNLDKAQADLAAAFKQADSAAERLVSGYADLKQEAERLAQVDLARGVLDVKPHRQIEAEIQKVRDAFDTLRNSGTLSNSELAQAALKTQQRIDELKSSTNGWAEALGKAHGEFLKVGGAGTALYAVSKQAIEFESALADIAKTTGMGAEQVAALGDRLKAMATQLPINADGLAKIAAAGGQLGVANKDIEQFVTLAAKIASAFDIPVEQASEAVAALTNNFGLSIQQVASLGDTINVLGNKTAATEKDIVAALANIGGTAKQFGLTAEQAAGLADAMLALKMPTEVASTAINAMLSKLQTARVGSKDFQEALGDLGLSADALASQIQANPQQALSGFLHTLEKLDAQSRAEILTRMFGEEHQDEIGRLVGALKLFDDAMGIAADKTGAAGAMQKEFETRLTTTENQLKLMNNAIEGAAINLGSVFLPAIRAVAEGIKTAAQAIADFEDAFPHISGLAASLATAAASVGALRLALLALGVVGAKAFDWAKAIGPNLTKDIGEAATQVSKVQVAFAGLSAFIVGWDIGTALREKFEIFRVAGVAAVEAVAKSYEYLRYSYEAYQALVSKDTLVAVEERHQQRLVEMDAIFKQMYADAKDGADKAAQGAQNAADKTQSLGQAGQKAGNDIAAGQQQAQKATGEFAKSMEEAAKSTEGGAKKFGELVVQYDLLKPDNADKLVLAMGRLGEGSEGAAKIVRDELLAQMEKLGGPELQAEIAALKAKLGDTGIASAQLADAIKTGAQAQFKALGLDGQQALTGVSAKVRDGVAALDNLKSTLDAAGVTGTRAGGVIKSAFTNVVQSAQTTAELGAISDKIVELGQRGELTSGQMTKAFVLVAEAQKKIGVGADEVRAAQDKASRSANELAAAVSELTAKRELLDKEHEQGLLSADGLAAAEKGLTVSQELMARAAKDAAEALRLQRAVADETGPSLSELAARITEAEKRHAANALAADRNAQAQKDQADASKAVANAADQEGQALQRVWLPLDNNIEKMKALSQATADVYAAMLEATTGHVDGGWLAYAATVDETNKAIQRLEQSKTYVDDLTAGVNEAVRSGQNLAWAAMQTTVGFGELNAQHLDGLQAGIDAAKAKLESLRDAAKSTVNSVLDELDQFNGNLVAVENRSYETRKASIEELLRQAQQAGDAQAANDYRDALGALEKLHQAKLAKLDGKRAGGGDVQAYKTYLVGEEGIELFVADDKSSIKYVGQNGPQLFSPSADGYIIPHGDLAGHITDTNGVDPRIMSDLSYGGMAYLTRDMGIARQGGSPEEVADPSQFLKDLIAGKLDPQYDVMIAQADQIVRLRGSLSEAWRKAHPAEAAQWDARMDQSNQAHENQATNSYGYYSQNPDWQKSHGVTPTASYSHGSNSTPGGSGSGSGVDYSSLSSAASTTKSRVQTELAQFTAGGGYTPAATSTPSGGGASGGTLTLVLMLPNGTTSTAQGTPSSLSNLTTLMQQLSSYGYGA